MSLTKPTVPPYILLEVGNREDVFFALPLDYENNTSLIKFCDYPNLGGQLFQDETIEGAHFRKSKGDREPLVQGFPVHPDDLPGVPVAHKRLERILTPPTTSYSKGINRLTWLVSGLAVEGLAKAEVESTFVTELKNWLLYTAPEEDIPALFKEVATREPHYTLNYVLDGLRFIGKDRRKTVARDIMPLLQTKDLQPLLMHKDPKVRQRAILALRDFPAQEVNPVHNKRSAI